jgi:hydrogenase maturation protease
MTIAVIGAGTVIFNDEGVGVYAQKYLENNYDFDTEITFVDGGVLGFKLMTYYQEYDKVIILDTITMEKDIAGSIYNMPASELMGLGSYKQTAHEVEIVEMLEICSLLETMADVNIIGIVPDDILLVKADLSQTLKDNFDNFINAALSQLKQFDISFKKKENIISLDDIIYSYAYPNAERNLEGLK